MFISAISDDCESQDMYLYEGLPVIGTRTKRDKEACIEVSYGRIVRNTT